MSSSSATIPLARNGGLEMFAILTNEETERPHGRKHRREATVSSSTATIPLDSLFKQQKSRKESNILQHIRSYCNLHYKFSRTGDANVLTAQHGWFLLQNRISNARELYLWNPCSLQKFELPHLTCDVNIGDCILSSSPTATDQVCDIFLFSSNTTSIFYCQLGDDQWTEIDYREDLLMAMKSQNVTLAARCKNYLTNPIYCNGCLYAESMGCYLVEIEKYGYRGLKINLMLVLIPTLPPTRFHRICRLLGSNNELFRIEILHTLDKVISIVVYKFELSQLMWRKVKSIKDRMLFISNVGSPFACQAINPETEGGRIYFTLPNNNFVYIYNIEEKSLMFSHPLPNLPEMSSSLMWFMPDIRMRADIFREERRKAKTREKESICGTIHLNEKGDTTTHEFYLPFDMVGVIAKHLYGFDYLHFRASDRLFRRAAPPVQWNAKSMLRFDDHSVLCPFLVFLDMDNVFTFVHPKLGLKYKYSIKLPEVIFLGENANVRQYLIISDCEICYSKDGWLLLTMKGFSFFLNPFTKKAIPFKYGPITTRNAKCLGFSSCPNSYKCVIVDFYEKPFREKTPIFRLIDTETRYDSSFQFEHGYFSLYNKSPTFHNGTFYFLSNKGTLGLIKLRVGGEGASWIELKGRPQSPCPDSVNNFLVECNGNQLAVFEGPFCKWVRVFKLNESTMTWTKVESLGNYMLFVGNTSFSAKAKLPGMENKIYFPRFYGQSIVFYSLETNNYSTFENEVLNYESVREPLNSGWIEPRWK